MYFIRLYTVNICNIIQFAISTIDPFNEIIQLYLPYPRLQYLLSKISKGRLPYDVPVSRNIILSVGLNVRVYKTFEGL